MCNVTCLAEIHAYSTLSKRHCVYVVESHNRLMRGPKEVGAELSRCETARLPFPQRPSASESPVSLVHERESGLHLFAGTTDLFLSNVIFCF
jgi:hypothetical protein